MTEMSKLQKLLKDNEISFEIRPHELFKNAQLFCPNKKNRVLDVVTVDLPCNKDKYLEVMVGDNDPIPRVSAEQALDIIKKSL